MNKKILTKNQQIKKAISILKKVGCDKCYLEAFKKGIITVFGNHDPYYIDSSKNSKLLQEIKKLEERDKGTVYAVYAVIRSSRSSDTELYFLLWVDKKAKLHPLKLRGNLSKKHKKTLVVPIKVWEAKTGIKSSGYIGIESNQGKLIRTL